jgi:hypothetical protein
MSEHPSELVTELCGSSVIDAHLMFVACDGAAVILKGPHGQAHGRFDLADGFAEIAFLDQSPDRSRTGGLSGALVAEYYVGGQALHRFQTRIVGHTAADRYRLLRPRRIAKAERRGVPRLPCSGEAACTFDLERFDAPVTVEVVDISNQGARLVVSEAAGFAHGGHRGSGWLRLAGTHPLPMEFEVRHVAPAEHGRRAVGVVFTSIRPADRRRLTETLVELRTTNAA